MWPNVEGLGVDKAPTELYLNAGSGCAYTCNPRTWEIDQEFKVILATE